jgi:uroporphyrinogen decarboxylase
MGLGLEFATGEGPKFARPVRTEEDVARLAVPDIDATLRYVTDAVREIRTALTDSQGRQRVPLIGFSGSPWTLACYMVEGSGSADFRTVKSMLYARPDLMHRILDINARSVAAYLNAQIEAGAQAVMIFDTWGGALADGVYQRFSLHYIRQVVSQLKREHDGEKVPVITFTKGGGMWLDEIAESGVDAVGLDWTVNLRKARERVGSKVARAVLDSFGNHPGHVFNLGHGISQFTPPENVAELVDEVHRHSRAIRSGGDAPMKP